MNKKLKALLEQAKSYTGPDGFHAMVREMEASPVPDIPDAIRLEMLLELADAGDAWEAKVPAGVKDHSLMRLRLLECYLRKETA